MSQQTKILVIIPVYNNAKTVSDVIVRAKAFCDFVLVVNDGSTDGSGEAASPASKVISHKKNKGKGAALITGFQFAEENGFTHAVTIDADGQHFPEDLPKFFSAIENGPSELLLGHRNMSSDSVPGSSKFGRLFSNFWVYVETGVRLTDTQSGYRCYPLSRLDIASLKRLRTRSYDFEIEILVSLLRGGVSARGIDVSVLYDRQERVSHFRVFRDNFLLTLLHTRLCVSRILGFSASDRERSGAFLLPLCLKLFGLRLCYLLLPMPMLFYFVTGFSARRAMACFYNRLFPNRRFSNLWRAFYNFINFGYTLLDRTDLAVSKSVDTSRFITTNRDLKFHAGSILVGAHFGDWFCTGIALSKISNVKMTVVLDTRTTKQFDKIVMKFGRSSIDFIDINQSPLDFVLAVKRELSSGSCLCFLGDRVLEGQKSREHLLLGDEIKLPTSVYELATILKAPVYNFFSLKDGMKPASPFTVHHDKIWDGKEAASPALIAERYLRNLEKLLKEYPQHWFNFYPYWTHDCKEMVIDDEISEQIVT